MIKREQVSMWYLKQIPLFKAVKDMDLERLLHKNSVTKRYKNKERLYSATDMVEQVYVLKEGEIILYRSANGKRTVIDVLKPGDVFGNISFSDDGINDNFAEASQDSYACVFNKDDLLELFRQYPELALTMLQAMSNRMHEYEQKLYDLSSSDAKTRVVRQLETLAQKEQRSIMPTVLRRTSRLTHERLGEMTGLSRETVTRVLAELKNEGTVTMEGKQIILVARS
jgi:CRP/FNR family transcriptional regulator, cyclic AMP receptor protein